jgi:hypothetical protein
VRIFYFRPFPKKRVGFIKKENRIGAFRLGKNLREVFLGFTNILADHRGEIDFVELQFQFVGDDRCRHGLSGAGHAMKQRV